MAWLLAGCLLAASARGGDRFVDPSAAPGGDGSRAHPLRSLAEALAPGAHLHLAKGEYPGGFTLADGVVIEGAPGARVANAQGPALIVTGRAEVQGLSLEGGPVAVRIGAGAQLTLRRVRLTGANTGLEIDGGQLVAEDCQLAGRARGIVMAGGRLVLRRVQLDGELGLRIRGGEARLEQVSVGPGGDTGIYVASARLQGRNVRIANRRNEGLLTGAGAEIDLVGVAVTQAGRLGIGIVKSQGSIRNARVSGVGGDLAELINSQLTVSGSRFEGGRNGVLVNGGQVTLVDDVIHGARGRSADEGGGLVVRQALVLAKGVRIDDVSGSAVWVAQGSQLRFGRLSVHGIGEEALVLETRGQAHGDRLEGDAIGGPALRVSAPARLELGTLQVSPPSRGWLAASCSPETRIVVRHGLPPTPDVSCRAH